MTQLQIIPPPPGKEIQGSCGKFTDAGNAKRLADLYGDQVRYFMEKGRWHIWDGKRWVEDRTLEIFRLARQSAEQLYDEARKVKDFEFAEALKKWSLKSESKSKLEAAVELLKSEPGIIVQSHELDADPFLLNVENGTIDLKTGELREYRKEDLITKIVNIPYYPEPGNDCPRWESFLFEICGGDHSKVQYIKRAIGYSITGSAREQCFFYLYGKGANGKTVFIIIITCLTGSYATTISPDAFMVKNDGGGATPELAKLLGARTVTANEVNEGRRLDEATIKAFTGNDQISARQLYRDPITFRPQFKLWMSGNHKPDIRGTDEGIWRRVNLIPFNVTFPPEKRDKHLEEKLRAELPGILRWAVQGCLEWQRVGLNPPPAIARATEGYRGEMDIIGLWFSECCRAQPGAETSAGDLYRSYRQWTEANGHRSVSQKKLGSYLKDRGFENFKSGTTFWAGIEICGSYAAESRGVL